MSLIEDDHVNPVRNEPITNRKCPLCKLNHHKIMVLLHAKLGLQCICPADHINSFMNLAGNTLCLISYVQHLSHVQSAAPPSSLRQPTPTLGTVTDNFCSTEWPWGILSIDYYNITPVTSPTGSDKTFLTQ